MKLGVFFTAAFLVASVAGAFISVVAFILYLRHRCAKCCRCLSGSKSKEGRLRRQSSSKRRRNQQDPISMDAASLDMLAILEEDAYFGGLPSGSNTSEESKDYESAGNPQEETASVANTEHPYSSLHFKRSNKGNEGELTPLAILMAVPESIRRTLNFSGMLKKSTTTGI